ncbi:oxidoreductase [Sulfuriferula plumbiphila]|uniref:Zinc-type alcohol dehydrogenase-like protein n=1 Tax=Sulfuriferula plumbiphila TaxID=171865 RepID=A0A512L6G6_9PROT|nr:zinc-binding alcohol dehydrogenase family protein [Sulfuriferula plumbiphila]BBP04802.1 oxidoreductase [Sulfuriferula plumbiphila]GEP30075.1 oxidoreductase [Sulfuriferula plumbiphila]
MKAVGYRQPGPLEASDSLIDIELPRPRATGRDLLVEVQAVSVNPVDTKLRRSAVPTDGEYKVLGFDAVGIVREVGTNVTLFKPGDEVWYAGAIDRAGCNSEFHLVDERVVGRRPRSISAADAAALPLTGITAWELLFDRLQIPLAGGGQPSTLLIVGAAGGVGSILIQLACQLTQLTVVATASRPETQAWARELGAHQVIDHHQPLLAQLVEKQLPPVNHVISLTQTERHFEQLVEILAPQGKLALIDDPGPIDVRLLKRKSLSLHWELMFTRSLYQTGDMQAQHKLLNELAGLVDLGIIRTTARQNLGNINAANLLQAHRLLESGQAIGKVVLEGF